jgi:hypothetical protein
MHILRTEAALWEHIRPSLLGRHWRRLENTAAHGEADAYGLFAGQTHWLELKIGKPGWNALRSSQQDFIIECARATVPAWCCFAWKGRVLFFRYYDFEAAVTPPFYRTHVIRLRLGGKLGASSARRS